MLERPFRLAPELRLLERKLQWHRLSATHLCTNRNGSSQPKHFALSARGHFRRNVRRYLLQRLNARRNLCTRRDLPPLGRLIRSTRRARGICSVSASSHIPNSAEVVNSQRGHGESSSVQTNNSRRAAHRPLCWLPCGCHAMDLTLTRPCLSPNILKTNSIPTVFDRPVAESSPSEGNGRSKLPGEE